VSDDRTLPHSIDAERAVLGAALVDPRALRAAREHLSPRSFYRDAHERIFAADLRLADRGVPLDIVTLKDELERSGDLERAGGPAYIGSLVDGAPVSANVEHYARIVAEKAHDRATINAADALTRALIDRNGAGPGEAREGIAAAEDDLRAVLDTGAAPAASMEPMDLTQATADVEVPIEFGAAGGEVLSAAGDLDVEAGEVGAGKSLAMAMRCCAKVLGQPWLGFPCAARGRALLVCADGEGPQVIRFRLSRIAAGFGVTLQDLHRAGLRVIVPESLNLDDPATFAAFHGRVQEDDPDLIGIDSLNVIVGPDRDTHKAADMGAFIRLRLRPLQVRGERPRRSLSVAHHLRKRQGTPGGNALKDRVANSYYTLGGMDSAIGLEPSGDEAFIVRPIKRSRWGTFFKPFLVRLEGSGKEPLRAVHSGALKPSDAETAALENDVLEAVNALSGPEGWVKVGDIKRHLGVKKEDGRRGKAVERAAKRLAGAGKLESHATIRGCFRIPRQPDLPDPEDESA
jgi:hypothetical protein